MGGRDGEISRRLGQVAAMMQSLYRTVVVKRELSHKAKLSIFRALYIPNLTYGQELWILTERMRSRVRAAEISFLRRMAGLTLHNRVRSSAIRERLKVDPLLLCIERSQLRWFGHLIRPSFGGVPGTHNWDKAPRSVQNLLERLFLSINLGTAQSPPG